MNITLNKLFSEHKFAILVPKGFNSVRIYWSSKFIPYYLINFQLIPNSEN